MFPPPFPIIFRHHPHFHNVMKSRVTQLMGVEYKFDMTLSEDGSGRGAALVAAVLQSSKEKPIQTISRGILDMCSIM